MITAFVIRASECIFQYVPIVGGIVLAGALVLVVMHWRNRVSQEALMKVLGAGFVVVVIVQCVSIVLLYVGQYLVWKTGGTSAYFLPPYQPWAYFMQYSWFYFARPPIATFCVGVLFFVLYRIGYGVSKGRFFYEDEQYTGALAILANPWPQSLLVVGITIVLGLCIALTRALVAMVREALRPSSHGILGNGVPWGETPHRPVKRDWCVGKTYAPHALLSLRMLWPSVGLVLMCTGRWLYALLGLDIMKL